MKTHRIWPAIIIVLTISLVFPLGGLAQDPLEILQEHDVTTSVNEVPGMGASLNVGDDAAPAATAAIPKTGDAYTIGVLSDLHIRKDNLDGLESAIRAINGLAGMNAVAITGDLDSKVASPDEFDLVRKKLGEFNVPVFAVTGNHDYIYDDTIDKDGKKSRATKKIRREKLERFRSHLNQKGIRYSVKAGGHLLVFLPLDALEGKPLAQLSDTSMEFLKKTLAENPRLPTVIFCHAPLTGSYERKTDLGPIHGNIQPADKIRGLLKQNPQVFLWVAGHLHIRPGSKDFSSKSNKVDGVTVIHVPNIMPKEAWIQTIRLSPEAAVVRTYSTRAKKFLPAHDRIFRHTRATTSPQIPPKGGDTPENGADNGGKKDEIGNPASPQTLEQKFLVLVQRIVDRLKTLLKKIHTLLDKLHKK
ncbi:MAG TPA: metallophosphoesterase [Candidatus Ozemobacteraceae bacterium]|nr:metallophosphoesterase [Candidatus Ozemobacteraceae bacterium]HQG28868.1 metallophosphoesterase [Candidatus Ozemobacteraceae bacterium]